MLRSPYSNTVFSPQNVPIQRARIVYEKVIQYFPTFGKYWKLWAEHEVVFPPIFNNRGILTVHINGFYYSFMVSIEFKQILSGLKLSRFIILHLHAAVDVSDMGIWLVFVWYSKGGGWGFTTTLSVHLFIYSGTSLLQTSE